MLYVDAALPYPGRSWLDEAPPLLAAEMRGKAVNGVLPRWSDWWDDPSVIETLVPDAGVRERFVNELPLVPSGYLGEPLPGVEWHGKAGYLQLSAIYAEFADAAEASGWPLERRNLDHLATLTAPAEVASALSALLVDLTQQRA